MVLEGTITVTSGNMFHIYQLSSVNSYPIFGPTAKLAISRVSVFYIEEMEALSCITCVSISYIGLSTSSIFLLNRGNFNGTIGFAFSGGTDGSSNWFGVMGNRFDVDTAVQSAPGGTSTFAGNYMSIYGNYYSSGWSQSASTCWAMCNSRAGTLVGSPAGGCSPSDCIPSTLCNSASRSQCNFNMAHLVCTDQKPVCVCNISTATTEYCIPFVAPAIPTVCVSTESRELTVTSEGLSFSTPNSVSLSSKTLTDKVSLSESERSPTLSQSPMSRSRSTNASKTQSETTSPQWSLSQTRYLSQTSTGSPVLSGSASEVPLSMSATRESTVGTEARTLLMSTSAWTTSANATVPLSPS
jgi:hypothetical protein